MEKKTITRRDFIKTVGIAAGASLLAACGGQATPEKVEVTRVVTEKETQIESRPK